LFSRRVRSGHSDPVDGGRPARRPAGACGVQNRSQRFCRPTQPRSGLSAASSRSERAESRPTASLKPTSPNPCRTLASAIALRARYSAAASATWRPTSQTKGDHRGNRIGNRR